MIKRPGEGPGRSERPGRHSSERPAALVPWHLAIRCPWKGRRSGPGKDRGAVTAEFAVALPAVLLLLAMLLAGAAAGVTQLRIEEAARAGARALARGEGSTAVAGIARRLAGDSATASVSAQGEWMEVTVTGRVGGPFGAVIPWTLTARASARTEMPGGAAASRPGSRGAPGSVDFLGFGLFAQGTEGQARGWEGQSMLRGSGAVA
jgi:TadE-like protein